MPSWRFELESPFINHVTEQGFEVVVEPIQGCTGTHGALRCPNDTADMTSAISSSVPVPPGNAMNASPSSIILALRSAMSLVTIRSSIPSC